MPIHGQELVSRRLVHEEGRGRAALLDAVPQVPPPNGPQRHCDPPLPPPCLLTYATLRPASLPRLRRRSCDDEPYRAELRAEFKKLAEGKDELPMVKRSCATALKSLAVAAAKTDNATAVLRDDIMSTLQIYLKDKDSSVRVNATDALVGLIEGWCAIDTDSAKMCWVFTNAFVLEAINDDSWRVRHALMKGYGTIATSYVKSFGAEADPEHKVSDGAIAGPESWHQEPGPSPTRPTSPDNIHLTVSLTFYRRRSRSFW